MKNIFLAFLLASSFVFCVGQPDDQKRHYSNNLFRGCPRYAIKKLIKKINTGELQTEKEQASYLEKKLSKCIAFKVMVEEIHAKTQKKSGYQDLHDLSMFLNLITLLNNLKKLEG